MEQNLKKKCLLELEPMELNQMLKLMSEVELVEQNPRKKLHSQNLKSLMSLAQLQW